MDQNTRRRFNQAFTAQKYQNLLDDVISIFDHRPNFRIAETPVFIDRDLKRHLLRACDLIVDEICKPEFKQKTDGSIAPDYSVPDEDDHTTFLQLDFGITRSENGELIPRLIEAQGFPSLYLFQDLIANRYRKHFDIPEHCSHLLNIDSAGYHQMLRQIIVGKEDPKNVVLLEIEPDKQTTRIDFLATEAEMGVKTLCISDLKRSGRDVYYVDENGKKVDVHRIYNRVIFDELVARTDIKREFLFSDPVSAYWVGHPNWFFRISKYSLPLFDNPYVPKTWFLKDLSNLPDDLENYVLKPMFSFSGSGVVFNVSREAIERTSNLANYILQEKIHYEPVVVTPGAEGMAEGGEPVKCEVRMLMLWPQGAPRPMIVNNLARLSKGEMIGVKYNRDKDWVGGSVGFFLD